MWTPSWSWKLGGSLGMRSLDTCAKWKTAGDKSRLRNKNGGSPVRICAVINLRNLRLLRNSDGYEKSLETLLGARKCSRVDSCFDHSKDAERRWYFTNAAKFTSWTKPSCPRISKERRISVSFRTRWKSSPSTWRDCRISRWRVRLSSFERRAMKNSMMTPWKLSIRTSITSSKSGTRREMIPLSRLVATELWLASFL